MSPVIPCSRSASSLDRVVDGEEGLTCSKAPADITTAFEQAMSSLTVLAEACRAHGIDPMAMLATTMGGAAVQGAVAPPSQSTQMPRGDFDASADSHGLIDALDRGSPLGIFRWRAAELVRWLRDRSRRDCRRCPGLGPRHRQARSFRCSQSWVTGDGAVTGHVTLTKSRHGFPAYRLHG